MSSPVHEVPRIEGWIPPSDVWLRVQAFLSKMNVPTNAENEVHLGDMDGESAYVDLATPNDYRIDGMFSSRSLCVILGMTLLQSPNQADLPAGWEDTLLKLSQAFPPPAP